MSRIPAEIEAQRLADSFHSPSYTRSGNFPARELEELSESGLLGIALPRGLGGAAVGLEPGSRGGLLPVLREVGRGNLVLGRIYEGHVNALLLLHAFGTRQQLSMASEDVLKRGCVYGVWNTGPPDGPTLVPCQDGTYRLNGVKTFATGALRIQRAIVTASLPGAGWQMSVVPLGGDRIAVDSKSWDPLGMEESESFTIRFCDLPLESSAILAKPGDYYAEPMFTSGVLRFCAVQLGGAQALFDGCRRFLRSLHREDDPFQLQRIGEMAVLLESGRHWLTQAQVWLETDSSDRLCVRAQMMRIATEEICTRVIQLAQISVGARGLAFSEPVARTLRDLQMYVRQAGYDQAFQTVGRDALLA